MSRKVIRFDLALLAASVITFAAYAQRPQVVTDHGTVTGSSRPGFFASDGVSLAAFAATDQNGTHLWLTDGTAGGTVPIVFGPPGFASLSETNVADRSPHITFAGSNIYFFAETGFDGGGLWVMDRTERRPRVLQSFLPGTFNSGWRSIVALDDNSVLFRQSANSPVWVTDGTVSGTRQVNDIDIFSLVRVGSRFFYEWESELRVIEGDVDHPRTVTTLPKRISSIVAVGDIAILATPEDSASKPEVWRSDATAAGTYRLHVGQAGSITTHGAGNTAFWVSHVPATGTSELWSTRGTEDSTTRLGAFENSIEITGSKNGRTLFRTGSELWITDGTQAGTERLRTSGFVAPVASSHTHLFFVENVESESTLWAFDGTGSLRRLGDARVSTPYLLPAGAAIGESIIFSAGEGSTGFELWTANASINSPQILRNIGADGNLYPLEPVVAGGRLFFSASSATNGRELWASEGTPAGTRLVRDIHPGLQSSSPSVFLQFGNSVMFRASSPGFGLEPWMSDGTEAGTRLLGDVTAGPSGSAPVPRLVHGGLAYFIAASKLWKTDGSESGTAAVAEIQSNVVAAGGALFFETPEGLARLAPGNAAPQLLMTEVPLTPFMAAGNRLFLTSGGNEVTLWTLDAPDGTPRRVRSFATLRGRFGAIGNSVVLIASDGIHGLEAWISDGTLEGTKMLADISPGAASSQLSSVGWYAGASDGQRLLFAADDGVHGFELWTSDGTEGGTRLLSDIRPGAESSWPEWFRSAGGRMFFAADDGVHGRELWSVDTNDPRMIADLEPGIVGSAPSAPTLFGDSIIFAATTTATGRELWRVPTSDGEATRRRACCRR